MHVFHDTRSFFRKAVLTGQITVVGNMQAQCFDYSWPFFKMLYRIFINVLGKQHSLIGQFLNLFKSCRSGLLRNKKPTVFLSLLRWNIPNPAGRYSHIQYRPPHEWICCLHPEQLRIHYFYTDESLICSPLLFSSSSIFCFDIQCNYN